MNLTDALRVINQQVPDEEELTMADVIQRADSHITHLEGRITGLEDTLRTALIPIAALLIDDQVAAQQGGTRLLAPSVRAALQRAHDRIVARLSHASSSSQQGKEEAP